MGKFGSVNMHHRHCYSCEFFLGLTQLDGLNVLLHVVHAAEAKAFPIGVVCSLLLCLVLSWNEAKLSLNTDLNL